MKVMVLSRGRNSLAYREIICPKVILERSTLNEVCFLFGLGVLFF